MICIFVQVKNGNVLKFDFPLFLEAVHGILLFQGEMIFDPSIGTFFREISMTCPI